MGCRGAEVADTPCRFHVLPPSGSRLAVRVASLESLFTARSNGQPDLEKSSRGSEARLAIIAGGPSDTQRRGVRAADRHPRRNHLSCCTTGRPGRELAVIAVATSEVSKPFLSSRVMQ